MASHGCWAAYCPGCSGHQRSWANQPSIGNPTIWKYLGCLDVIASSRNLCCPHIFEVYHNLPDCHGFAALLSLPLIYNPDQVTPSMLAPWKVLNAPGSPRQQGPSARPGTPPPPVSAFSGSCLELRHWSVSNSYRCYSASRFKAGTRPTDVRGGAGDSTGSSRP
jgi:hypothetical protein